MVLSGKYGEEIREAKLMEECLTQIKPGSSLNIEMKAKMSITLST